MGGRQQLVSAFAGSQNNVISMADAIACGYDDAEVDRLCRNGEWTRLRRGFYAPSPPPEVPNERHLLDCAAALRALEIPDAAIAHLSAARLWGVKWLKEPENSDVWVAWDVPGKPRYYPGLRVLPSAFPSEDLTSFSGLPISTPARAAVDLARHLPFEAGVVAVDSLRYRHRITDADLAAVLGRCRGWPHVKRARRTLDFSIMDAESPLESRFRVRFAEIGLGGARWQVEVLDAKGVWRRVDAIFGKRAGIEIDGKVKYKTQQDLWEEKVREDALREIGIPLLRLTADDLRADPRLLRQRVIRHMIKTGDWVEGVGPVAA